MTNVILLIAAGLVFIAWSFIVWSFYSLGRDDGYKRRADEAEEKGEPR